MKADLNEEREGRTARRRGEVSTRLIDALPGSPRFWSALSLVCLTAAATGLVAGRTDAAFVVAALGVVAWFINVRNHLRARDVVARESDEQGRVDDEERLNEND